MLWVVCQFCHLLNLPSKGLKKPPEMIDRLQIIHLEMYRNHWKFRDQIVAIDINCTTAAFCLCVCQDFTLRFYSEAWSLVLGMTNCSILSRLCLWCVDSSACVIVPLVVLCTHAAGFNGCQIVLNGPFKALCFSDPASLCHWCHHWFHWTIFKWKRRRFTFSRT